ncbi:MAG: ABC transporter permease subunit [Candidatus Faecivicinus sp.]|nr:ABC transporter permease subunit [Candidatus Faecivicinus sp.]
MRKRNQPGIAANRRHPFLTSLIEQREMWLLCVPIIAWVLLFCYYPMYGLLMAFVNYTPGKQIWECGFVGLKYFKQFINGNDFWRILRNTLAMSGLNITVGFIAPILFAFMLNELGNPKVKKLVQTASYLPHFISWVVAGTMVTTVLGTDGVVNDVLISLGSTKTRIQFLQKGEWYWWIITIVNIWKSLGWSAIIYLSAMAGVSEELCEAGAIDGMGRLGIAIHITLPAILPTIVLLWIMQVGNVLSAGFDQHLIIGNTITQRYWEVIDTYTYRYGVQNGYYSLGTAVSLMKSVIGFVLVLITNAIARKVGDVGLF